MAFAGILAQALRPSETSRFSLRPLCKTVLLKLWDRAPLVGQGVAKGGTRITWGGEKNEVKQGSLNMTAFSF